MYLRKLLTRTDIQMVKVQTVQNGAIIFKTCAEYNTSVLFTGVNRDAWLRNFIFDHIRGSRKHTLKI